MKIGGRALAWAEYGDPTGEPVFYFSGGDSSRLEGAALHVAAKAASMRIIAPDRPGFGASDGHPKRKFVDWSGDVTALANFLSLERFSVVGLSGGGPHALATCWTLPNRVRRAVIIASAHEPRLGKLAKDIAFPFRLIATLTRSAPWAMRLILRQQEKLAKRSPSMLLKRVGASVGEADRAYLTDPENGARFVATTQLAYCQGPAAAVQEHEMYCREWGFSLEEIETPLSWFIGDGDVMASKGANEAMANSARNARFEVLEGVGHLSIVANRAELILAALRTNQR